jgi:hypothetical protein
MTSQRPAREPRVEARTRAFVWSAWPLGGSAGLWVGQGAGRIDGRGVVGHESSGSAGLWMGQGAGRIDGRGVVGHESSGSAVQGSGCGRPLVTGGQGEMS